MAGLAQLINLLQPFLPLRTVLIVVALIALALSPWWVESIRDRQIRGTVRRMVRAEPDERAQLRDRVLTLAGHRPGRLVAAVDAAIRYDLRDLRDRALAELERSGKAPEDVVRLRARIQKPPVRFRDPLEAVVRIEGMLEGGLEVGARELLAEARAAFRDDPDLARLAERLGGDGGVSA